MVDSNVGNDKASSFDWLGLGAFTLGAAETGYNIYTNKRDYDYQKALQKQMFEREDTAIQRRMTDLKTAGLNPNLAAGSPAAAGSVVSRSNTNDIHAGSAIDYLTAWRQLKGQTIANEINKSVRQEQESRTRMAQYDEIDRAHKFAVDHNLENTIVIGRDGKPYFSMAPQIAKDESLYENEVRAKIAQNDWIPQSQKNELQRLINDGYKLMNENQRLLLEQNKFEIDAIYKKWQMNQISTNDMISNYARMFGLQLDADKLQLALDKLGWDKDKFTAEMIVGLFNGLSDMAADNSYF